jgi:hypothetical protein
MSKIPLMANPASASANVMAVRCPPADQPETINFARAMPYRDPFARNQRMAMRTSPTISVRSLLGPAYADQSRVQSLRQRPFR